MPQTDSPIARHFADLPDPRVDRTKKHLLGDILVIALVHTIAGADSWEEVEAFGEAKEGWLKGFPALPNGIPSHDTFYRVFARLDPQAFGDAWPAGCPRRASRPGCVTSPSTARPSGRPRGGRSAGACTWSVRGRPRTG